MLVLIVKYFIVEVSAVSELSHESPKERGWSFLEKFNFSYDINVSFLCDLAFDGDRKFVEELDHIGLDDLFGKGIVVDVSGNILHEVFWQTGPY